MDNPNNQHGAWLIFGVSTWRADFDLSGETPAGPYVCLRHQFVFNDFLDIGEFFTIDIYDVDGGPVIGSTSITNNFGVPINNVGHEIFVSGTALADGIGFELLTFSQPIDMQALTVRGHAPPNCIGGAQTSFVPATLTEIP